MKTVTKLMWYIKMANKLFSSTPLNSSDAAQNSETIIVVQEQVL